MKITERLNQFINEVATIASSTEPVGGFSFSEFEQEYRDQIKNNDYLCVVTYAKEIGVSIPEELKGVLENQ